MPFPPSSARRRRSIPGNNTILLKAPVGGMSYENNKLTTLFNDRYVPEHPADGFSAGGMQTVDSREPAGRHAPSGGRQRLLIREDRAVHDRRGNPALAATGLAKHGSGERRTLAYAERDRCHRFQPLQCTGISWGLRLFRQYGPQDYPAHLAGWTARDCLHQQRAHGGLARLPGRKVCRHLPPGRQARRRLARRPADACPDYRGTRGDRDWDRERRLRSVWILVLQRSS